MQIMKSIVRSKGSFLPVMLVSLATGLAAQEPPPRPPVPARVPRPAPSARPALPPAEASAPLAPLAPRAWPMPEPALAPMFDGFRGSFSLMTDEAREMAREQARLQAELAREQGSAAREMAREQAQLQREMSLQQSQMQREMALEQAQAAREMARVGTTITTNQGVSWGFGTGFGGTLLDSPPRAWAQSDPADSAYRAANDVMMKGDYRKAAAMFKEIPAKYPYSAYAADAMYWTAHALYRVGSTPDLQDALQVLDQLKQKYPNSRLRGRAQTDVASLQMRIAGVLSSRGQGGSEIVKRALAEGGTACDTEEQQVRSAALNALMQTDPDAAFQYAQKMLARKDDCSRDLRRNALFLIGDKRDAKSTAMLISAAKTDPSPDVRQAAVSYLARVQTDEALGALEELMKSSDDQSVQREAIRGLARNSTPRARAGIKALVERADVTEQLRITALDALDSERSTQEDVAWLQALYSKTDSPRIRSRIISAMGRIGGAQNEKWFTTLANNENESIEVRLEAVRRAGQAMDVAALGRLYDQTGQRQLRYELVRQLGNRKESESIDKLAEIAKNGTDPEVRMRAISALQNKKDEKATKVLLGLIDKPEKE